MWLDVDLHTKLLGPIRSYTNAVNNGITQNKPIFTPNSIIVNDALTKFLDDFKAVINPLIALFTTVVFKFLNVYNVLYIYI